MDTFIKSFVLSADYIKKGIIRKIYFSCKNGLLETIIETDTTIYCLKKEQIFTDTFTVESYLEDFFLKRGGRIEYQSKFSLEEDIKRMINAYSTSYLGVYEYLELNNGVRINVARHNHCADIFANSSQFCMNETIVDALE